MAFHTESGPAGGPGAHCLELGALDPEELSVFATLIAQRRPLPIYLGDVWRCDVCLYECREIGPMADHILAAHEPEPMNDADRQERWADDCRSDRGL